MSNSKFVQRFPQTPNQSSLINLVHPQKNNSQNKSVPKDAAASVQNHPSWIKWLNGVQSNLTTQNYYGNPSELLNSDFNFQTGIATPITQADGNGAFFSEKWQIQGAGVAVYSITSTIYPNGVENDTGSEYFENVVITAYSAGDFYFYQERATTANITAQQILRRYQNRVISASLNITNNTQTPVSMNFEIYFNFDPGEALYDSEALAGGGKSTFQLSPGSNEISAQIATGSLTNVVIGAAAYAQFRLRINNIYSTATDFDIHYIKFELADQATILYVDHPLELTRIANS